MRFEMLKENISLLMLDRLDEPGREMAILSVHVCGGGVFQV